MTEWYAAKALVFTLAFPSGGAEDVAFRFLLEYLPSGSANYGGYLRITIEDPCGRRLALDSIPHVEVRDLERRTFIAGSTRIATT